MTTGSGLAHPLLAKGRIGDTPLPAPQAGSPVKGASPPAPPLLISIQETTLNSVTKMGNSLTYLSRFFVKNHFVTGT